jgi:molybdopterin converting factor small subunit
VALIIIPATLRDFCAGASKLEVPGATIEAVLREVDARCPGFYGRVVEENRRLRPELAFAINGEVYPLALHDSVAPDAEIAIVPAIGGG